MEMEEIKTVEDLIKSIELSNEGIGFDGKDDEGKEEKK